MSYIVKIIQKESINYISRDWRKVADSGNERDGGAVYDYAECPETRNEETEVFKQEVEELDFTRVIKAINNIY